MVFAIVHFTVGFVSVLTLLWLLPVTRYRLSVAFLGGIWGLIPDAEKLLEGELGALAGSFAASSSGDVFFFHYTLDQPFFRELNIQLTFVSLVVLGIAFLLYDWRFGRRRPSHRMFASASEPTDRERDRL